MGVAIRRYIDILIIIISFFPTPLVLALFFAAASLFLCSFLKYFFVLSIMDGKASWTVWNSGQQIQLDSSEQLATVPAFSYILS